MTVRSAIVQPARWNSPSGGLPQKAGVASDVLAEAKRLAERSDYGPLLNQLMARACELLEDIDEILVTLDPLRNANDFATAAALHRELERIQAVIPSRKRVGGGQRQDNRPR